MKRFIFLAAMMAVCNADSIVMASSSTDKTQKTYNTIPSVPQKTTADIYYTQQYQSPGQQQVHYQAMVSPASQSQSHINPTSPTEYLQFVPRQQYYLPAHSQPVPTAIMIIAQPALLPHHLVYGSSAMQQLLNYFHSNPQAKYQLLHGNYPGAGHSTPSHQFSQAAHSIPQIQYVAAHTAAYPAQYANYIPMPVQPHHVYGQYQTQGSASYSAPQQTGNQYSLNQLATLAAQTQLQHVNAYSQGHQPARQAPAIITGLENFTPEQQAQIKQQLSSQLGPLATLAALGGGSGAGSSQYSPHQTSYGGSSKVLGNKITDSAEEKGDGPFIPFDPSYRTISGSDSSTSTSSKS